MNWFSWEVELYGEKIIDTKGSLLQFTSSKGKLKLNTEEFY